LPCRMKSIKENKGQYPIFDVLATEFVVRQIFGCFQQLESAGALAVGGVSALAVEPSTCRTACTVGGFLATGTCAVLGAVATVAAARVPPVQTWTSLKIAAAVSLCTSFSSSLASSCAETCSSPTGGPSPVACQCDCCGIFMFYVCFTAPLFQAASESACLSSSGSENQCIGSSGQTLQDTRYSNCRVQ
jgi:hypothetical protein